MYMYLTKMFIICETETNRNKRRNRQNLSYMWRL